MVTRDRTAVAIRVADENGCHSWSGFRVVPALSFTKISESARSSSSSA